MSIQKIAAYFFLLTTIVYIMSYSYYLAGGTANVGIYANELYYMKHASIVILANICFLYILLHPKQKINKIIFIIPVFTVYIFLYNGLVYFLFISFIFASILLSESIEILIKEPRIHTLFLFLFLLVPLIDYLYNNSDFIYNTYYGRARLLLGYFHPKEAGLIFLVLVFLVILGNKIRKNYLVIFHISVIVILFFIQSRNALLFYMTFLIFNFLIKKFKPSVYISIYILFTIFLPLVLLIFFYDQVNEITSNRLDLWISGIEFNAFGKLESPSNTNFLEEDNSKYKFHIDNFYLEFMIEAGYISLLLLVIFLVYIGMQLNRVYINGYSILSIYLGFLLYCAFDAGMFSSGNYLNLFIWSLIAFSIKNKKIKYMAIN